MSIYPFDHKHTPIFKANIKDHLGGKGANLNHMMNDLKLPVPPGFTIVTEECAKHETRSTVRPGIWGDVMLQIAKLESKTGRMFGDPKNPLLVSVRSGAKFSMPGMMDTVLNLGLTRNSIGGLADQTNEAFALDSYRRFLQMYGTTVLGIDEDQFKQYHDAMNDLLCGMPPTPRLSEVLINKYEEVYENNSMELPDSQWRQLDQAIMAVFRSWNSDKAKSYRKIEKIPSDIGTAVNIQVMVFGNLNDNSATGVAFTRNPNTGENKSYGDFLINAQGEDVVAGTHITTPLANMDEHFPSQAQELDGYMHTLEHSIRDMCDIEFTVEDGKLWMLQVRAGKRAPAAAMKIATDLADEGIITNDEAQERISAIPVIAESVVVEAPGKPIGKGLAACPGQASGLAAFTSDKAKELTSAGKSVILIREMTNPDDVEGMSVSAGIVTAKGGLVSHAAVVARGWGKPCVVSCMGVDIEWIMEDVPGKVSFGDVEVIEGESVITIDGTTGEVFVKE